MILYGVIYMQYILKFFFLILIICFSILHSKVLIITHAFCRPDFIELQLKSFNNFLLDDFEFVVFNDAENFVLQKGIQEECERLSIKHVFIPQEIHSRPYLPRDPGPHNKNNRRHVDCVQYSMDVLGFDFEGVVGIIDSDMFMIQPFSIENYMQNKDIAGLVRRKTDPTYPTYFSPAICFMKMNILPNRRSLNFNCGKIGNWVVDSGGYTHLYLKSNPKVILEDVSVLYSGDLYLADDHRNISCNHSISTAEKIECYKRYGFNSIVIDFLLKKPSTFEFYLDNVFFHLRGGSTTDKHERIKFSLFKEMFEKLIHN